MLAIEGLTAGYDGAPVLRNLDLEVGAGEVVALLGPNGAGKTTTLRAISGIVRPLAGTIRLAGEDLARRSPAARARLGIAHMPEGRGVFFGLTVAEHFRLAVSRVSGSTRTPRTSTSRPSRTSPIVVPGCSPEVSSRCSRSGGRSRANPV